MQKIIARIARGRGKTPCYLFVAYLMFAAVQTAQAAQSYDWYPQGSDLYYTTSANWKKKDTASNGRFFRNYAATNKRTVLFNANTTITYDLSVESAATTDSAPYIFRANDDSKGLTSSGSLSAGTMNAGHLAIQRGTYQFQKLFVGGHKSTTGNVLVIGGSGNNATVTNLSNVSIAKDTMQVKAKGKLICRTWAVVGSEEGKTATLTIDGGEVQHNNLNYMVIGDVANSTGYIYVQNGGKYSNTGSSSVGLAVGQKNVGTLEVDNGTVDLGEKTLRLCDTATGRATVNVKGGGLVISGGFSFGSGSGGATITIDGGTIRAGRDNAGFIPAVNTLNVYVGENGATFDTAGHTITIGENLQDVSGQTGCVRFIGGGTAVLSAGGSYTGVTTVEVGTTVNVPSPSVIGGGLAITVPAVAPAEGIYTLLVCDGEGVFTDDVLSGVDVPEGARLSISPSGKAIRCTYGDGGPVWIGGTSGSLSDASNWANNAVPGAGTNCVIGVDSAATLTVGDTFAASSITFLADTEPVTINAADNESMTGIEAITSLSATVSHTINVPVYFTGDIQVKQAAMAEVDDLASAHVTFAGGAYAAAGHALENGNSVAAYSRCIFGKYYLASTAENRWSVPYQGGGKRICLGADSYLYVPYAGQLNELYVAPGAKVDVEDMALDGRFLYQNFGEVAVTNVTVMGSADLYMSYDQGMTTPGVFKFESVTNTLSDKLFYLGDVNSAGKHVFYIGAGGLNSLSSAAYCLGNTKSGSADTIRPWYSDFTIADGGGEYSFVFGYGAMFCTDDENGVGRTITIDAATCAAYETPVTISGSGTLKVNKPCQNTVQPSITVTETATLEYAAGASLGTGALTLGAGTTLVVARADLPINVASLALPESGTATIQITGDIALANGDNPIICSTSGLPAGFAEKLNIVAPDGTSPTRRLYTADNGTIVLFVGDGDLPDRYTWTGAANDGKMNTRGNWRGNEVPPAGATVFIPPTAGALDNNIGNFAPASITFGYGSGSVAISGNAITGVTAITNLSAATHDFTAPVAFADKILVVQGAMSWEQNGSPNVYFAGGVTGTTFETGTARYLSGAFDLSTGEGWVANTQGNNDRWGIPVGSCLTLPSATDTSELVMGGAFTTGVMRTSTRLLCGNSGEYVVTNELEVTLPGADIYTCWDNSPGDLKFEKIVLGDQGASKWFYISSASSGGHGTTRTVWIGKGGLAFASGASANTALAFGQRDGDVTYVKPWHSGYTIGTKTGSTADVVVRNETHFGTTDETGNACTVTADGIISGAAAMYVEGKGTFVVNSVCTATSPVTVYGTDGTTLAINAGKKLTTGTTTVNSGATLEVAQSGTVALGGDLTLKAGAALGFNFTSRADAPVLDVTGKTVKFDTGATTNVVVKLSANDGARPLSGTHVLTSGGKFADATVSIATGAPKWVKDVSVEDGNLVLNVKPSGTLFIIR